ncbi:SIS domain-containing protein [Aestuariibius sp. 2305UL40-4]|uniref:KpsF/GutQ family sugar-phosphate isomerase n=1 Tax=Aestuariibius violaceus TaxID=3234132 RepID=UPI00345ED9E9
MKDAIDSARRVLRIEARALDLLAEHLPTDFETAVEAILNATGRVIVSGIGKSGHVGRKIAATLASTGTPTAFVHAAEASHGDLGMISQGDICLLISNSGETPELRDIVAHVARFSIPMIAISSKPHSALMQAADYRLLLPDAREACAIGMAPTTSTTMTMALGDALAVALMERKGFAANQFRDLHPGGKLGAQLVKVSQLMHADPPLVAGDASMEDAILEMTSKGFGITGVTEGEHLTGVITDGDLRRNMAGLMDRRAGEVATRDPAVVGPDMLAAEALGFMNDRPRPISVVLVVDGDAVVGVLHMHDLLRAGVV